MKSFDKFPVLAIHQSVWMMLDVIIYFTIPFFYVLDEKAMYKETTTVFLPKKYKQIKTQSAVIVAYSDI